MAQTDPVYITFEFRGDIDKEVNKVTLGIKGLRDEAATTYNKLIADSSAAYNAMSAESRKLATTMQENISVCVRFPRGRNSWTGSLRPGP